MMMNVKKKKDWKTVWNYEGELMNEQKNVWMNDTVDMDDDVHAHIPSLCHNNTWIELPQYT